MVFVLHTYKYPLSSCKNFTPTQLFFAGVTIMAMEENQKFAD